MDLQVVASKCPREEDLTCSFNLGLCGFTQEEVKDDLDWLWHDGSGHDDPYLPGESLQHTHYIYMDTTAPEVFFQFALLPWSGICQQFCYIESLELPTDDVKLPLVMR